MKEEKFSVFDVIVESPIHFQGSINAAVDAARELSKEQGGHGILITQHSYTTYSVAISPEVPLGMTMERRQRQAGIDEARLR